jgi:hypothetical protein
MNMNTIQVHYTLLLVMGCYLQSFPRLPLASVWEVYLKAVIASVILRKLRPATNGHVPQSSAAQAGVIRV